MTHDIPDSSTTTADAALPTGAADAAASGGPGVRVDHVGAVATVTLSNPSRLNAMTRGMWLALRAAFDSLNADPRLHCVIVRGDAGNFCAGGDISEYPGFRYDAAQLAHFHEAEVWGALEAMLACPVPVVAQIEGACMGAGVEIASCCDVRIAGHACRFGAPIAKLGFPMAPREAALVQRAVGDVLARDMLFAAGVHDSQRLYHAGFLLRVLPDADVAGAAVEHADKIAALAPQAARANKATFKALAQGIGVDALVARAYDYADTPEHREGIGAFLEKRTPRFQRDN